MIEKVKKIQSILAVTVDGDIGPKTLQAICAKIGVTYSSHKITTIKVIQKEVGVAADGIIGPKTLDAIIVRIEGVKKPSIVETLKSYWQKWFGSKDKETVEKAKEQMTPDELIIYYTNKPVTFSKVNYSVELVKQASVRSGKSCFGKAGDESNLVNVSVPSNYPLKYEGKRVKTIRIHKLIAERLAAALNDIINHYGDDIETVAPGACVYDGSFNFRKTTGTSSYSIHSWGIAIDFDAAKNTMKMSAPQARLSQNVYKPFMDILEHHGFMSLGRRGNYDWQHFQACNWDS